MDSHVEKLSEYCRLCAGKDAMQRRPANKAGYQREILQFLGLDIGQDIAGVHPKFICDKCRLKLQRQKMNARRKKTTKSACSITLVPFEPHGESCHICKLEWPKFTDVVVEAAKANHLHVRVLSTGYIEIAKIHGSAEKVSIKVIIDQSGSWTSFVHGREKMPAGQPECLTIDNVPGFVKDITTWKVCHGNSDFLPHFKSRTGGQKVILRGSLGQLVCEEEDGYMEVPTLRHVNCRFLVTNTDKCDVCKHHRPLLFSRKKRDENQKILSPIQLVSATIRNDRLPVSAERAKLQALTGMHKQLKRKVNHLEEQINRYIEENGQQMTSGMSKSLAAVMAQHDQTVQNTFPSDSPACLLWEQQKKVASRKGPNGMRWHPAIVRWCIALHSRSPAAYRLIRGSRFLVLPHENTLRDYTMFTESKTGINVGVINRIKQDIDFENLPEYQKDVSLVFDEMKIRSGLVYSSSDGRLIGFSELGDVAECIEEFANALRKEEKENIPCDASPRQKPEPATHVLALMVRGLFSSLAVVIAHYPCIGFTSYQLYPTVWKSVGVLESAGFRVRCIVSDGASPNRKFYRLHEVAGWEGVVFFSRNRWEKERRLFFVCDAPHLMKTTRNNWENSHWNKKTRNLQYNKQQITWPQLLTLVEQDIGTGTGLRHLPRIQHEHLYLQPSLRMKVKLAVQVLSSSVASAFRLSAVHGTESTIQFVTMMDQFFDCLNVSKPYGAKKPWLQPYRTADDFRFTWLEDEFLKYLDDWETESLTTPDLSMAERRKLCLSRETLEGFRITVKSFTTLGRVLLKEESRFLLSEKFSQDPLEEHFSMQRGSGGRSDNPSVGEFGRNCLSLQVAKSACTAVVPRGNCSRRETNKAMKLLDSTPLTRRKLIN